MKLVIRLEKGEKMGRSTVLHTCEEALAVEGYTVRRSKKELHTLYVKRERQAFPETTRWGVTEAMRITKALPLGSMILVPSNEWQQLWEDCLGGEVMGMRTLSIRGFHFLPITHVER